MIVTRIWMGLALGIALAGCSGTPPFGGSTTDVDGGDGAGAIPEVLAGNLQSFTYNPANGTLSIEGVPGDNNAANGTYRRRPAMDRGGYQAYTAQNASNGRHSTVFIKDIDGTRAAVVATGVQYQQIYAGGAYSNEQYSRRVEAGSNDPNSGLVYYTGRYVGLLNGPGSSEDLIPPNAGEDPSPLSVQAAEVTGEAQVTADFATNNVDGIIYNRVVTDYNDTGGIDPNSATPEPVADLAFDSTTIAADGTFQGDVSQANSKVGDYGGIFGGERATAVAGVLRVENHIERFTNEIEHGVFVLGECVPPLSGPDCDLTP